MEALEEFKNMSGLIPSIPKSQEFFCNVPSHVKNAILSFMSFDEGTLPVKYLGVPLISSRLIYRDCRALIEKVQNRLNDCKNKSLSFAGRIQLVISVISSMHVYWASVFILPSRVIADLEKMMRGFLWCQRDMKRGKAKVSWEDVCLPKNEGGLGIRRIGEFNVALTAYHIWSILTHRESLWVRWIHSYKLKGRSFWEVGPSGAMSWGRRKLLQVREGIRPFIWHQIGNGKNTFFWHGRWCDESLLKQFVSNRDIARHGLQHTTKVTDLLVHGNWNWPHSLLAAVPIFSQIRAPPIIEYDDWLVWKDTQGRCMNFSVGSVWKVLRPRGPQVNWFQIVWFPHCIPRQAFHLWLVMRRRLKTQDVLRQWEVGGNTDLSSLCCPLCKTQPDSHDHLFFQCSFSMQVWSLVKTMAGMDSVSALWDDIVAWLSPMAHKLSAVSIIGRLLVAVTTYFIWQERNNRLFGKDARSGNTLLDIIATTVRLKLLTMKFENMASAKLMIDKWRLPSNVII